MLMPKMTKGKRMSNMLTNGAMFSTFKRAASPTVRGRSTQKNGVVIYERISRNSSFDVPQNPKQELRKMSGNK